MTDYAGQLQEMIHDLYVTQSVHLKYMVTSARAEKDPRASYFSFKTKAIVQHQEEGVIAQDTEAYIHRIALSEKDPYRLIMEASNIGSIEFTETLKKGGEPSNVEIKFSIVSPENVFGKEVINVEEEICIKGEHMGDLYITDGNDDPVHMNSMYLQMVFNYVSFLDNYNILYNRIAKKIKDSELKINNSSANFVKELFRSYNNEVIRQVFNSTIKENISEKKDFVEFIMACHHFEEDAIEDTLMRFKAMKLFNPNDINALIFKLIEDHYA